VRRRADDDGLPRAPEFTIPYDSINEMVVLAAALASGEAGRRQLLARVPLDHFLVDENRAAWVALKEMQRRGLAFDVATLQQVAGEKVRASMVEQLMEARPGVPANLDWHVESLAWDRRRVAAAKGSFSALAQALKDPQHPQERVRALAKSVHESFAGGGSREHLYDPEVLVREMMDDVRARVEGRATHPFGLQGLDLYETGERRMVAGAVPGQVTIITGVPGSCKSTLAAHLALGTARLRKRVLYGAWEVSSPMTIELMAVISLRWRIADVIDPNGAIRAGRVPQDMLVVLEERAHQISKWVYFMKNPFRRSGMARVRRDEKNERNLDIVEAVISDSGCDVFVADLWRRCLSSAAPDEEEEALFRQQSMLEELGVHGYLVHQQRSKDLEQRQDKRPTREGIKGSSAYLEVADNMLGTHRPAHWKKVPDNVFEIFVLKQKKGPWPLGVAFDWDGERGMISGGASIEYDQPGETGAGGDMGTFVAPGSYPGERRGGRGKRG
jgi:replicative DNA helicase